MKSDVRRPLEGHPAAGTKLVFDESFKAQRIGCISNEAKIPAAETVGRPGSTAALGRGRIRPELRLDGVVLVLGER
jgi:hypothetical protein